MQTQHNTSMKEAKSFDYGLAGLRPVRGAEAVRIWLLVIAAFVYAMILVGGATRLTDSGLSITEWKPVTGVLPPLDAEAWAEEFQKYKDLTAEYALQNKGMSLAEFKQIFWWEWGHRLLGRFVGVVFLLPFLAFWALGWTTAGLRTRLWGVFALGGLQGFIGWWMGSSGVGGTTRVDVAPYRLMTHFSLALLIICGAVWVWLSIGQSQRNINDRRALPWAIALLCVASLQMMLGALVAGLDAGRTYTDWPLMDGNFIPKSYWVGGLGVRNLFENVATAQFNHRIVAYILIILAATAVWRVKDAAANIFRVILGLVIAQALLGIYTLINAAPLWYGLAHQALGAVLLIATTIALWRCVSRVAKA